MPRSLAPPSPGGLRPFAVHHLNIDDYRSECRIGTNAHDESDCEVAFEHVALLDRSAAARQFLPPHQQIVPLAASWHARNFTPSL